MKTEVKELLKEAYGSSDVCQTWKDKIKAVAPELFPLLEVGKWYKTKGGTVLFFQGMGKVTYGFSAYKEWVGENHWFCETFEDNFGQNGKHLTPATKSEVETALIAEIKKRYPLGSIIKWLDFENENPTSLGGYSFNYHENKMYGGGNRQEIFNNGKWATVIEQEPPVHINAGNLAQIPCEFNFGGAVKTVNNTYYYNDLQTAREDLKTFAITLMGYCELDETLSYEKDVINFSGVRIEIVY